MKIVTLKNQGGEREMSDIDEDSDVEDIKERGKRREREILMKIVTLKTIRRGERGQK